MESKTGTTTTSPSPTTGGTGLDKPSNRRDSGNSTEVKVERHIVPVLQDNVAQIAATLLGATTPTGNLADYFTKEDGIIKNVKDDKLVLAIKIAKRLVELSAV